MNPEQIPLFSEMEKGSLVEVEARLRNEIKFYKKEVEKALEENNFASIAGLGQRLMGLENQLEHWKHFGKENE